MTEKEISKAVVDAAIEVHRELGGPGLIEDVLTQRRKDAKTQRRNSGGGFSLPAEDQGVLRMRHAKDENDETSERSVGMLEY